jgi:hypothetical protein
MDLKNAAAVCLISLFSATLVVLIARSLDSQAAARLEPQLIAIAEELQAIRKQSGPAEDELIVYYLHNNQRCETCVAIESQTKATLDADFAPQLKSREIVWKVRNFQEPAGMKLAETFKVTDPVVVLVRMKNGEIEDWKALKKVRGLYDDKEAFRKYVRDEIIAMRASTKTLTPTKSPTPAPAQANESSGATPKEKSPPTTIPSPKAAPSLPIPK